MKKEKKEIKKLREGDELIFQLGERQIVEKVKVESIDKKEDFTFETVLSSEYKLNNLRKAKEEGYFIKCVFVLTVDPQINIARIESRVSAC